ncbi:MAG: CRISPR-associated endonuclease Cas3'' [Fimbriimonadaceae bacterium]|nr:MAG: CRISPR-associated endonuclease Cas3'' [Fimbriimonadaceae bacterium]
MSVSDSISSTEELFAHTPGLRKTEWHGLVEHSKAVAERAAGFASRFGGGPVAWRLGWWHDAAKADPRFQRYLRAAQEGRPAPKCPHSVPGAVAGYGELKTFALVVAGHHGGLHDRADWKGMAETVDLESVAAASGFVAGHAPPVNPALELPKWVDSPLESEMFVRMAFSCLVDADRLDTEAFRDQKAADTRGGYEEIGWYRDRLSEHLGGFKNATGHVNKRRRAILESCLQAASQDPGVFSLTVPTGGGKTLSGLAFALNHAVAHGKRRVIVAIPYTSIIDQTASVYEGIFVPASTKELR